MNEEKKLKRFASYESVPLFLSGADVSNLLGLSRTNVYYLFREKDFPAITIGKRIMVRREKLFAWIDAHEKATTEHPQHPFQKQTHQQQSKQKGVVKNGNY